MMRLVCAMAAVITAVSGHCYMSNPRPTALTVNNHAMRSCPQCDGNAFGNCVQNGNRGPIQVTWEEGQEVTIQYVITANHRGWHELRFCDNPTGNNACLSQTLATAKFPTNTRGCPTAAPGGSTHRGSCIPSAAENRANIKGNGSPGTFSETFILPQNFTCAHCNLQW